MEQESHPYLLLLRCTSCPCADVNLLRCCPSCFACLCCACVEENICTISNVARTSSSTNALQTCPHCKSRQGFRRVSEVSTAISRLYNDTQGSLSDSFLTCAVCTETIVNNRVCPTCSALYCSDCIDRLAMHDHEVEDHVDREDTATCGVCRSVHATSSFQHDRFLAKVARTHLRPSQFAVAKTKAFGLDSPLIANSTRSFCWSFFAMYVSSMVRSLRHVCCTVVRIFGPLIGWFGNWKKHVNLLRSYVTCAMLALLEMSSWQMFRFLSTDGRKELAKRTVEMLPEASSPWNNLGYVGGGTIEGVHYSNLQCVEKALSIDPGNPIIWYNLGCKGGGHLDGKKYTPAECYVQALKLRPTDWPSWKKLGALGGGRVDGKYYSSRECMKQYIATKPSWVSWKWIRKAFGRKYAEPSDAAGKAGISTKRVVSCNSPASGASEATQTRKRTQKRRNTFASE